ncbi:MAG: hypothetical protein L7S70_08880 [Pseudomonadales bacterium]|nr:hypothetical protein [Pseudomonadales bacterium]MCH1600481.1 hypothetical protein [Pseudomonadales bacterium]
METQTANPQAGLQKQGNTTWAFFDRWIFVFMAGLLLVTVLTGFIPSGQLQIYLIEAGQRDSFLPVVHVHAFVMGAWILLLLAQTSLVATDNRTLHRQLGMVGMVLMPAMVVTGFVLVPSIYRVIWGLDPAVVPPEVIAIQKETFTNISLAQIRIGILFPIFVALALSFRKSDPENHKRLMILATVMPIPAALDRILWLPNTMPDSPLATDLYTILLILPMFAYDLLRNKRIPKAYIIWFSAWLPTSLIINLMWSSPWWLATAPMIMGVE